MTPSAEQTIHRGPDRRRIARQLDSRPGPLFVMAAATVAAVWTVVTVVGLAFTGPAAGMDAMVLRAGPEATIGALAVVTATVLVIRWRLAGEARLVWLAAALTLYGLMLVGVAALRPVLDPGSLEHDVLAWVRASSRLVVFTLLVAAIAAPPVSSLLRFGRILLLSIGAVGVVTVAFQLAPNAGALVASHADGVAHPTPAGPVVVTATWVFLAAFYIAQGYRQRRAVLAWIGLVLAGFALGELNAMLVHAAGHAWSGGTGLVRLVALIFGLTGALFELQHAVAAQSNELMRTTVSRLVAEAKLRADRVDHEERAHEARNALTVLEGATRTLEAFHERLSPEFRAKVALAISSEIARLQRLVDVSPHEEQLAPFRVRDALDAAITSGLARGMDIRDEVPDDLVAHGRWADTAAVVQNLLENARRYAPGTPVTVRAAQSDDHVLIRIEDRGPGIPADEREAIFGRGMRGRQSAGVPGSGLGLYVSTELAEDQGGVLWAEERPGGGAAFVLALRPPVPAGLGSVDRVTEGRLDAVQQPRQVHRFVADV